MKQKQKTKKKQIKKKNMKQKKIKQKSKLKQKPIQKPTLKKEKKQSKITSHLVEEVATELVGEEAVPIIKYIKNKKSTSEFKIASGIREEIHKTRNILYRLFDHSLVSFIRKKDKKKGWYICYWDLEPQRVKYLVGKIKKQKLENLKDRLKKEQSSTFFMCKNACTRVDFEKAIDMEFKCPECGSLMNQIDNKRTIEFLNNQILELEKEIA